MISILLMDCVLLFGTVVGLLLFAAAALFVCLLVVLVIAGGVDGGQSEIFQAALFVVFFCKFIFSQAGE